MDNREIQKRIKKLPDHLVPEVIDYIDFLISKHGSDQQSQDSKKKLRFDCAGGLADLKDQYTSVELQHKSLDWR